MSGLITSQHAHFRQLREAYVNDTQPNAGLLAGRLEAARRLESCSEKFQGLMDAVEAQFLSLNTDAEKDIMDTGLREFPLIFNTFMVYLGHMRQQGEFEGSTLDQRNNASAFLTQVNRLGMELIRAGQGIEALRKTG